MNLSLIELYGTMGGFAKGIVVTLAVMSIWSLTVMLQKWWFLRSAQAQTRKFAPEFSQFLEEDNLTEAINLAERYKKSHVARVLGNALSEIKPLIADGSVTVADINSAERAIEREMLMTIVLIKRGLGILATTGSTAPFVGLLGTVWGIMNSFIGISNAHTTNLAVVAPGIAEALLATALGLFAAIPAVVIYNVFARWAGGYRAQLADAGALVMRLLSRDAERGMAAMSQIGRAHV